MWHELVLNVDYCFKRSLCCCTDFMWSKPCLHRVRFVDFPFPISFSVGNIVWRNIRKIYGLQVETTQWKQNGENKIVVPFGKSSRFHSENCPCHVVSLILFLSCCYRFCWSKIYPFPPISATTSTQLTGFQHAMITQTDVVKRREWTKKASVAFDASVALSELSPPHMCLWVLLLCLASEKQRNFIVNLSQF